MKWGGNAAIVREKMFKETKIEPSCIIHRITDVDATLDEIDEVIIEKRIVSIMNTAIDMVGRIHIYKIHFLVR
jgi:hypothetical protein